MAVKTNPAFEPTVETVETVETAADLGIHILSPEGTVLGCQYATYEDAENATLGVFAEIECSIVEPE